MLLDLYRTDDVRDMVHRTVQALVEGQLVGFPTETVYVVAAHSLNPLAVGQLRTIRDASFGDHPDAPPLVLSLRSREAAQDFLHGTSAIVRRLTHRCWPGPLTLRASCSAKHSALSQLPGECRRAICKSNDDSDVDGEISFRVVDQRLLSHVHRYLAAPLVLLATDSMAGRADFSPGIASTTQIPTPTTASSLQKLWGERVPLLLDDGPTRYGGRSTVVRASCNRWQLLNEGVIEKAAMNQFAKPVIAVVCTGNTCRSPMAEVLLRQLVNEKLGSQDAVEVVSAGVAAGNGCEASAQSVEVMRDHGLDLTQHASRMLDDSIVGSADLILTMTRGHRAAILAAWPELNGRVFTLRRDGGDVTDPVGMPVDVYRQCATQIKEELTGWLESLGDDFFPQEIDGDEPASQKGE